MGAPAFIVEIQTQSVVNIPANNAAFQLGKYRAGFHEGSGWHMSLRPDRNSSVTKPQNSYRCPQRPVNQVDGSQVSTTYALDSATVARRESNL